MNKLRTLMLVMAILLVIPMGVVSAEGEGFGEILNSQIDIINAEREESLEEVRLQLELQGKMNMYEIFKREVDPQYDASIEQLKAYYYEGKPPMFSDIRKMVLNSDYINPKYDEKYNVFL